MDSGNIRRWYSQTFTTRTIGYPACTLINSAMTKVYSFFDAIICEDVICVFVFYNTFPVDQLP
uniref:Uncharacterized protein n=1 Tax=Romanomermis culicivorax TaxID=13658 RepID=A0A915K4R0_ROMCU